MPGGMTPELQYMLLVFGLLIFPKALQRFRLPSAVTCVIIGAAVSIGFHLFHADYTIKLLSTLGIVAMFLFAGLEVEFSELQRGKTILLQHVAVQLLLLILGALAFLLLFDLTFRAALLFSLAVFTPSTGFILDSLDTFGLTTEERFWVKSKAIAAELVALAALFIIVQSDEVVKLSLSALAIGAMLVVLPPLFRIFSRLIAPFAPKTEFTFLILVALLCAFITRELGVYYLVGAFVVGVTAVRLKHDLPELTSDKLLGAVELFASFFIPFYFFNAGLHLRAEYFSWQSLGIAVFLLAITLPIRVYRVAAHMRMVLDKPWKTGVRIGTAVLPTLVFTIVIGEILRERFSLSNELFGSLIIFTLANTLVPGFLLRVPPPEYERHPGPWIDAEGAHATKSNATSGEAEAMARAPSTNDTSSTT